MKISATIITLNEQLGIARTIESLRCCDEILVVDSGSVDQTVQIAAKLGARIIESPWQGYAKQKNLAAEKASHDWILSIDADEVISEALEAEIWQVKKSGPCYDAYTMPRLAQYLGRWIYHSGWHPDRKVRLYHRRKATWVGEFVHESVEVDGSIGHLKGNLLHFTCSSLTEHVKSMERYTTLAAQELVWTRRRIGWRQFMFDPPWAFLRSFLFQRGFLDGREGLIIAYMAAFYTFLKNAKAKNMS